MPASVEQKSEAAVLAVDGQRSIPTPFLIKTYQLVDDSSMDDIISWNEDGTTFIVWRPAEFARDLLPNYFKHNNFSSFVRQLNTYGFRKIVPDRWEFANEFFRKGEKQLLCEIHRRKNAQTSVVTPNRPTSPSNSADEQGWSSTSSPVSSPRAPGVNNASGLFDENEKLKRENSLLISEVTRIKNLCNDILVFMSQHVNISSANISNILALNNLPDIFSQGLLMDGSLAKLNDSCSQFQREKEDKRIDNHRNLPEPVASLAKDLSSVQGFVEEINAVKSSPSTDGKLREVAGKCVKAEENETPKLFGVPLISKKRSRPCSADNDEKPEVHGNNMCTQSEASGKYVKSDLELELSLKHEEALPWLKFRSARDEKVCN